MITMIMVVIMMIIMVAIMMIMVVMMMNMVIGKVHVNLFAGQKCVSSSTTQCMTSPVRQVAPRTRKV